MLSTEFIILLLIFLVYISVWYVYMDKIIEATEIVIGKFEKENYVNEMSKKINTLCYTNGEIKIEFKKEVDLEIQNNILKIEGIERKINCEIENVNLKKKNFLIEKKEKIIVS
jgi:hypothetical protein